MYKIIIGLLIGGIVIGLCLVLYLVFGHPNTSANKITVLDKSGNKIEVNDYTKTAKDISPSAVTIQQEQGHASIFYNSSGNQYSIVLNVGTYEEFTSQIPAAEQEFLQKLGITQEEACRLNVVVENAGSLDERLQSAELPLSFCK